MSTMVDTPDPVMVFSRIEARDISKRSYAKHLAILCETLGRKADLGTTKQPSLFNLVFDGVAVVATVHESFKSKHTKRNLINSLRFYLKHLLEQEQDALFKDHETYVSLVNTLDVASVALLKEINFEYDTNQTESSDPASYVDWRDLVKARDKHVAQVCEMWKVSGVIKTETLWDILIVSLYTSRPPRRGEYRTIKLRDYDNDKDNFCIFESGLITFNDFKTVDNQNYDRTVQMTSTELDISKYLVREQSSHLFLNSRNAIFSVENWCLRVCRAFRSITGHHLGPTALRKIFVTNFLRGEKNMLEKKTVANAMGHSALTQPKYRRIESI